MESLLTVANLSLPKKIAKFYLLIISYVLHTNRRDKSGKNWEFEKKIIFFTVRTNSNNRIKTADY